MEGIKIPLYTLDEIPGRFENRVFIGGNYDNIAVLRKIADMVRDLGYQPILALDFDVPKEEIYSYDIRLLANCKYAIFEITWGNGHLMEIVRAQDFNVQTLLVYQARDESKEPPPAASMMVLTSAFPKFGYRTFEELREYLPNFLPPRRIVIEKELERLIEEALSH